MSVLEMRGLKVPHFRCTLYYGLVLVELVRSQGGEVAPFARKFRMERVSPYGTNHFWRGQSAG